MFRKLRVSGSKPAPSAPATTAERITVNPLPRAIHISDVRRSPTKLPREPVSDPQSISIIVANAKGAADCSYLYSVRTQRNMLRVPPAELTPLFPWEYPGSVDVSDIPWFKVETVLGKDPPSYLGNGYGASFMLAFQVQAY
ncbi:hypothetical protein ACN42_g10994 [Penicillium freii]|uniref:Uncharacterized protein n=1 Tax=Penicillium freii TaxID=48697 RepID=A0A117NKJ9_PENFR|nr:hypothetical protein ACN42_g10994 [Penicillium freii]